MLTCVRTHPAPLLELGSSDVHEVTAPFEPHGETEVNPKAAWQRLLPGRCPEIALIEPIRDGEVYRLILADQSPSVVAKRCSLECAEVERRAYECVLPLMDAPQLSCKGVVPDSDGPNAWLFVEDAGEIEFDPEEPGIEQRIGRWLGQLHAASHRAGNPGLSVKNADWYHEKLHGIREFCRFGDYLTLLSPAGRESLRSLEVACELLANCWSKLSAECDSAPITVTHGDLAPRNIRLRERNTTVTSPYGSNVPLSPVIRGEGRVEGPNGDAVRFSGSASGHSSECDVDRQIGPSPNPSAWEKGPEYRHSQALNTGSESSARPVDLLVFDWHDAGWGPPAIDLIYTTEWSVTDTVSPDRAAYTEAISDVWPGVTEAAVSRLGCIGEVFWHLLAALRDLEHLSPANIDRPLLHLDEYTRGIRSTMKVLGWA